LTITSLLRHRLGLRAWRAVHWIAYACWPVALAHGWGTGSDTRTSWMLAVTLGCAAAVVVAIVWRVAASPRARVAAVGATLVTTAGLTLWLVTGPLAPGWTRRSGTPPALLSAAVRPARPRATRAPTPVPALEQPFAARLRGSLQQGLSAGGTAVVDLRLRLTGGPGGVLRIRLAGQPDNGGVIMSHSAVTLGPASAPGQLQGRIDNLQGTSLQALVGARDGRAVRLRVDLALDGSSARGTVSGQPVGA
jgi:hypothetical protein